MGTGKPSIAILMAFTCQIDRLTDTFALDAPSGCALA